MKKKITGIFALLLAAVIGINISGCAKRVQAADLSQGITPVKVEGKAADAKYSAAQMNFALKLLEKTFEEKGRKSSCLSRFRYACACDDIKRRGRGNEKTV